MSGALNFLPAIRFAAEREDLLYQIAGALGGRHDGAEIATIAAFLRKMARHELRKSDHGHEALLISCATPPAKVLAPDNSRSPR